VQSVQLRLISSDDSHGGLRWGRILVFLALSRLVHSAQSGELEAPQNPARSESGSRSFMFPRIDSQVGKAKIAYQHSIHPIYGTRYLCMKYLSKRASHQDALVILSSPRSSDHKAKAQITTPPTPRYRKPPPQQFLSLSCKSQSMIFFQPPKYFISSRRKLPGMLQ